MPVHAQTPLLLLVAATLSGCTSELENDLALADRSSAADAAAVQQRRPSRAPVTSASDDDSADDVSADDEVVALPEQADDDSTDDDSMDDDTPQPEPDAPGDDDIAPAADVPIGEPEPMVLANPDAAPPPVPEPVADADASVLLPEPIGDDDLPLPPEPSAPPDASVPDCAVECALGGSLQGGTCLCFAPADAGAPADQCPDDPLKVEPATCGCGAQEVTYCSELDLGLAHRYSFEGAGTVATDSRGGAHGELVATALQAGTVPLAGADSGQYVNLPNGLISALGDASFEMWTTWSGGDPWQKIFDFGGSDAGEDVQGVSTSDLFLTPRTQTDNVLRVGFRPNTGGEMSVSSTQILPTGALSHIVVVFDDTANRLSLYADGVDVLQGSLAGTLAQVDDDNNWLGRSQWAGNPDYGGSIDEFRIYSVALTAEQIAYSFQRGPNATFFTEP